ncbi:uncharacterized protein [Misgurnus anguillicaudatus]|uniref:uncharacterized protein isoform X3 n=1 Tax=Misgurnus anguillicaudatus TaxID=75329 RepID=UPI003CCF6CE2
MGSMTGWCMCPGKENVLSLETENRIPSAAVGKLAPSESLSHGSGGGSSDSSNLNEAPKVWQQALQFCHDTSSSVRPHTGIARVRGASLRGVLSLWGHLGFPHCLWYEVSCTAWMLSLVCRIICIVHCTFI